MIADSYLKSTADNKVKFLTAVSCSVNRFIFKLRIILISNPVWFGELFSEFRRKVLNLDSVFTGGNLTLALSCDGI